MNGLVIVGAGVWVLCQLFAGDALNRLGIIPTLDAAPAPNLSPQGIPNVNPNLPFLTDPQGRPY